MTIKDRPSIAQQECILALLCHNDEHGKLIASLVDAGLFESDYRDVAIPVLAYWKQHGRAPGHHTADLLAPVLEDKRNPRKADSFRHLLLGMAEINMQGINTDYVLGGLSKFLRAQQFKGAILQATEVLTRPDATENLDVVEQLLSKVGQHRPAVDPGLALDDFDHLLEQLNQHQHNEFVTGIPQLDRMHVVPTRSTLMMMQAATSIGKSWFLIQLGRYALMQRKRVLHVTLELSKDAVQRRYCQNLLAIPKRDDQRKTALTRLLLDDDGNLTGFNKEVIEAEVALDSPELGQHLQRLCGYLPSLKGKLRIAKFPTGALGVPQLNGYLDALAAQYGFVPDLLIVDYAGIMRTDADNYRISLGLLVKELRGLAEERDIALATAWQATREGTKAWRLDFTHTAESFMTDCTADFVLSLNSSEAERPHKLARVWVNKARDEAGEFGVLLTQNYAHGQFALESAHLDEPSYRDLLEQFSAATGAAEVAK
jgi:hypothetical protein